MTQGTDGKCFHAEDSESQQSSLPLGPCSIHYAGQCTGRANSTQEADANIQSIPAGKLTLNLRMAGMQTTLRKTAKTRNLKSAHKRYQDPDIGSVIDVFF